MFGAEPHGTYNRILLSSFLGGYSGPEPALAQPAGVVRAAAASSSTAGVKAEVIDREQQVVVGGRRQGRGTLRLPGPGDRLAAVRAADGGHPTSRASSSSARWTIATPSRLTPRSANRAVVIGGGLLGLEAARGLLSHGLEVTVVEVAPHLMIQQLDAAGGALLKHKLEAMGVHVLLETATTHLLGDGRVTGVRFQDGSTLETDMVVISCGIRPNVEEARAAGSPSRRPSSSMISCAAAIPAIFAVGECAQHRGQALWPGRSGLRAGPRPGRRTHRQQGRASLPRLAPGHHAQGHGHRPRLDGRNHRQAVPTARWSATSIPPRASTRSS